ncbi:MAG: NAD-dependent epimerase/dehydratase [Microgenomates group bacterium GW2011_GWA2_37_6]|nr:MAG: NAD-dependent epimerase/dehydratase [Microgenomates group bacterium GW2011_GWA2_37_6]
MNNFWKDKKVLVTGGAGFIGSHVVEKLIEKQAKVTVLDNLQNGNLNNLKSVSGKFNFINGDCSDQKIAEKACSEQEIVMNLAARVGGIEFNRTHQAAMMRDNLLIGAVMLEAARKANVERFLVVSSACVYSRDCKIPTPESEGFLDEPEPTNGGYGWAKRTAEKLGMYYAEEFGMKVGIVRPYNCYGPRDHFDPQVSHVIPALIKRVMEGESPIKVWGSGNQTRAFLYVTDLAEGMIKVIEKYPVPDPINLGTDEEISVRELTEKIIKMCNVSTKTEFDLTKPDGSPRRNSDNRKAKEKIDFVSKTSLDEGLIKTIEWYRKNRNEGHS